MAKDRFKTRASWDTSFKYSGQVMPKYSTPKKERLSTSQLNKLSWFQREYKDKMNSWERDFVKSLIVNGIKTTPRQKEKLKDIYLKVTKND